jgi:hypothetical protein
MRVICATIVVLGLAVAYAACVAAGPGCSCGQSYESDPFGSVDGFFIAADHDESAHCFCRCGSDRVERMPPSATCEAYEGACTTQAGEILRYACE